MESFLVALVEFLRTLGDSRVEGSRVGPSKLEDETAEFWRRLSRTLSAVILVAGVLAWVAFKLWK